jgi:pimeloyl-ACP methyl ester carboxylesterase
VGGLQIGVDVGDGPSIVMLPGFGMTPGLYRATAELLAERCRVIVPDVYRVRGAWRHEDIVDRLASTLADAGCVRVTLIGHSFSGGIELDFATRYPERVVELVFADTLAHARELALASEALSHPVRFLWMATPAAAQSFGSTVLTHPRQIVDAAWFGFTSTRDRNCARVVELGLRAHVIWANRDSILHQADGRAFAAELGASFTVVRGDDGKPVDHDWIYRHPELFVEHIQKLDLAALRLRCDRGIGS